ncbi:MAG: (4Fe-4S)-binding protein [candidate division Zixibacteria bacterium SM23_81]|nr:MAG: (4Fe-4S)-binding protein [candidate division Zixibacteria bacterium SM23_81]
MKELVVISGKGGTGKTSIVGSFAALVERKVLADCDVDAADLHLLLEPRVKHREDFRSSKSAVIDPGRCVQCDKCREVCRYEAISENYVVDKIACEGCGVCVHFCPEEAIKLQENVSGQWFLSDTRFGPLVHAKLGIAEENSGKLVAVVRQNAKLLAEKEGLDLVLVDGAPGIGCPVISSIAGATAVLVVTEPTLSGLHDMKRVVDLAAHFHIPALVCVNKFDLNPELTGQVEDFCRGRKLKLMGRIPYDTVVTKAMVQGKTVVEYSSGLVAKEIEKLWRHISYELAGG